MSNTCKNCQAQLTDEQKFCSNCGQKADVHRINMHFIWHELVHAFTHADKSIFSLTKDLATQPGVVIKNYVGGKRKRYYNPFNYLLITIAISALLTSYFHIFDIESSNKTSEMMTKNFNKIAMIGVPVSSFFSWLLFRKSGYNYAENLIFHCFVGGFRVFFFLSFVLLIVLFRPYFFTILSIYLFVYVIYLVFAAKQFYNENYFLTIIKVVTSLVLTQMTMMAIMFIVLRMLK